MSYAVPDVEEVVSVARSLGIHLGPEEAVLYRKYLLEHLSALDEFVQSRIEEPAPPMRSALRRPGWKPSPRKIRSTRGCGGAILPAIRKAPSPARR